MITVTVLGVFVALQPARMLLFGILAIGPPLAVTSAAPLGVLLVGGYALAAAFAISTWQGLYGTADQVLRLMVVVAITVISCGLARYHQRLLQVSIEATWEREMLAAVAEQSSDAIITSTLDGVVLAWNSAAQRMYGWSASEVIGHRLTDILPPGREAAVDEALAQLAAGGEVHLEETARLHKDGTPILVSVTVWPIRDQNGVVVAGAATERDITEKKRREAEERAVRERSSRAAKLESLGQLAGGIAHDFNNLLAIILNYADFLADQVTGEGADDLVRIRKAAERAKSLTAQLLVFAKREPTQVEIIDLNQVVTEATELLSRTIGKNVELVCRPATGETLVRANRGRLDQILLNLVINARDAMPDGGVVVVGTDSVELGDSLTDPLPRGRYARLTVSDTGCGMTPEVRERLFEPFFTTKPSDRGTGLGLATVYGIVGDAGGTIGVDSTPGVGTTFRILLPLAVASDGTPKDEAAREPAQGHGELIMVVEDDEHVQDVVLRILRKNGYRAAALGEESLAGMDLNEVALVVTDTLMRGCSGPALAERLRLRRPDLRVLYMSGYGGAEVRRMHGIDQETPILQKPFTSVELLTVVGEVLAAAHANGA
ncbi:hybrid sensor histidine kinase/response regulator [Actinoplanes regularis]|uniref:histidine kinase n=1 Tax=Actinoplanes regularis TaxID=52697 RepID=A0A239HSI5_9ACTN|nr:PAS domain-containing sensor histidine kinase [Actinoplanes regularis]GIE91191.1 histidine kinase [Actinoplanes regularis]SNS84250.1 PAS domain S-box-containing protein [Actinoplanes regularis]